MEKRELEYSDQKSSKFWHIILDGNQHQVVFGRLGTKGQSKTKDFDSAEAAKASYDKLVASKLKKGYVDRAFASPAIPTEEHAAEAEGDTDSDSGLSPQHFSRSGNDNYHHPDTFAGQEVVAYDPREPLREGVAYRIGEDWDRACFKEDLEGFLASNQAPAARGLIIGSWAAESMYETNSSSVVEALCHSADRLPNLRALFFGDIVQEECEMSWIEQSDLTALLTSFPDLELLRTRGSNGLLLQPVEHPNLRALAMETGGMPVEVIRAICASKLPDLEYLELWIGTDDYGNSTTAQDLQPILEGSRFPKLSYLGIRNCEFVDDVAGVIVNSPLLDRIEELDLSLGTLSDVGGRALLSLPTSGTLRGVNLHYNFMSDDLRKQLAALPFDVDVSAPQEPDDDWRFVAVGE